MKKQSKLLVVCLVFAFVAVFSVSTVSASWMTNAVLDNVKSSATGNYTVKATSGTWSKTFTILSTDANAKSLLAIALTGISAGRNVTIQYTGNVIDNLYLLK